MTESLRRLGVSIMACPASQTISSRSAEVFVAAGSLFVSDLQFNSLPSLLVFNSIFLILSSYILILGSFHDGSIFFSQENRSEF